MEPQLQHMGLFWGDSGGTGARRKGRRWAACVTLMLVATTAGDSGGQECWDNEKEDVGAIARCLHDKLRALPPRAAAMDARLIPNVARAAAALYSVAPHMQLDAVELLNAALRFEPGNANLHFLRGNALGALGHNSRAAESYVAAITHFPLHVDALHNYAAVMMDLPVQLPEQRRSALRALQVPC